MTTIYLCRHAEADGNVGRRAHGHYNSLLTPKGHTQAGLLKERFEGIHIDAIHSSDLNRTQQTAKPLAEAKNLEIITHPELREIKMGDWEDKAWGELVDMYPEEYDRWQHEMHNCVMQNGEMLSDVQNRVAKKIFDIAKENDGKTVAVFCHGIAIRTFLCVANNMPLSDVEKTGWCDNTGVSKFLIDGENITVEFQNDCTHVPEHLSTLAGQTWWKKGEHPKDSNGQFRPVDFEKDYDLALKYVKMAHEGSYGSLKSFDEKEVMTKLQTLAKDHPRAVSFCLVKNEEVAFVALDTLDKSNDTSGTIYIFSILPERRGDGISPQILGQAISVYREMGKTHLTSYVSETNHRSLGFYKKFGFENVCACHKTRQGSHNIMMKKIVL